MDNVRQRKLKSYPAEEHIETRSKSMKTPRLRTVFISLVVATIIATYVFGFLATANDYFVDSLVQTLGYESEHHYAVVVDAGSSGTRVLAYKFRVPFTVFGPSNLNVVEEYFEQSKPGLSSYVDEPKRGADTIVQLIKTAESKLIPLEKRSSTPLLVRATAGLRLLPGDQAKTLVDATRAAIAHLGYDVGSNGGVEIMDGSDEGMYIWYTVNLLNSPDSLWADLYEASTMAALDLGGGSTQITFEIQKDELDQYPAKDQFVVAAGKNITLFTHSFLNLGLLAARMGIFRLESKNSDNQLMSSCVDPIVQGERWNYGNKEYTVFGAARAARLPREQAYARCASLARRYVSDTLDWKPTRAPQGDVAAMSYFYDVAADAGIIDVVHGGKATIGQYKQSALAACSAVNVDQPWACVDLVYITTLLKDAYKIPPTAPISLFKKVNGHEVSWALGLAYTTVMKRLNAAAEAA